MVNAKHILKTIFMSKEIKEAISATIAPKTANGVRKIAAKEKRSFSQTVDILLQKAIDITNKTERI